MTNVNPNTHFQPSLDLSVSDAAGSVAATEAERAALTNTSMEKENRTPRTEMISTDIHISRGVDALHSDVAGPVVNEAGDDTFQQQAKMNAPAKVGRNEPCPCGSGKKFKKCCGLGQAPFEKQKAATPDCGFPAGKSFAEFLVYQSKKYHEVEIHLLGDLEEVLKTFLNRHEHFSGSVYKVWFDFATRKVLDTKKVKSAYLKTGAVSFSDKPPMYIPPDLRGNTFEFQDFEDPHPIASMQALFDAPANRKLLDECEREFLRTSPASKKQSTGMTHEFLLIYDSKGRCTGRLLPDPTPSVALIRNQAVDFATRFPDYSGVVILKVKYDLDTRNASHVWCFNPATETWLDANDASYIRFVEYLFDANRLEVLGQVLDEFPHPVTVVRVGTPGENGKIEVKTISQEEHGQARKSIDVFVFLVKDKAGRSEVICHARSLDDAMNIFIPHHTFIQHRPKAGLEAVIFKVKLDLSTRKVLDADPAGLYKVIQVEPHDAQLAIPTDSPASAVEENRKLAAGMMQEFFKSQQQLFDVFQDPQTEVASSVPTELDHLQGTNPMVVEMFYCRDKNGQGFIGYDPEEVMAEFSKTLTPKDDNFLLSQKVKVDLGTHRVLSVQPFNPTTGELGSPQVPIAELQEGLQEAIDKVLPRVLEDPPSSHRNIVGAA